MSDPFAVGAGFALAAGPRLRTASAAAHYGAASRDSASLLRALTQALHAERAESARLRDALLDAEARAAEAEWRLARQH